MISLSLISPIGSISTATVCLSLCLYRTGYFLISSRVTVTGTVSSVSDLVHDHVSKPISGLMMDVVCLCVSFSLSLEVSVSVSVRR